MVLQPKDVRQRTAQINDETQRQAALCGTVGCDITRLIARLPFYFVLRFSYTMVLKPFAIDFRSCINVSPVNDNISFHDLFYCTP